MNFKMGLLENISEAQIESGAIYFAKDGEKQFGELYYDDNNNVRIKIAPRISKINFSDDSVLTLTKEDDTTITVTVPTASVAANGFMTVDNQHFAGIKTFPAINIRETDSNTQAAFILTANKVYDDTDNFVENVSIIASNYTKYIITNPDLINNNFLNNCKNYFSLLDWSVNQDAINYNGLILNGDRGILFFDSSDQTPGVSMRNGVIFCTSLGNENNPISSARISSIYNNALYIKSPYIYGDSNYYTLLKNEAIESNKTLILPNDNGELVYHSDNQQIGSINAPVYIETSGKVTACTKISTVHGGTGLDVIPLGHLMIGAGNIDNNNNAITTINTLAPVAAGSILVSNGINTAPKYAAPTLTWSAGNASTAPQISFNLNNQSTSVTLPFATSSTNGVVSTTTQTFAGAKTFSEALTASNTLKVNGKLTANNGAEIKNNLIATSIISSTNTTKSSIALSNSAISIASAQISLDGKIILTSASYGTKAQMEAISSPVEGQIFFVIE